MRNLLMMLIFASAFNIGCSQTKKITATNIEKEVKTVSQNEKASSQVSVFKMGLLSYESLDINQVSEASASSMVEKMRAQLEYEVIHDDSGVATLMYDTAGNLVFRTLYDYMSGETIEYLYTSEQGYMTIIPAKVRNNSDSVYFSQIFKKDPSKRKDLHGYDCMKITIMDPIVPGKKLAITYITEDIPYITKGFGELGKLVNGLPLETEMTVQGVKIVSGAKEYTVDANKRIYLNKDFDKFEKVSIETFNILKEKS